MFRLLFANDILHVLGMHFTAAFVFYRIDPFDRILQIAGCASARFAV